jgi:glucose-6-phosphate 1-dehydrogenase
MVNPPFLALAHGTRAELAQCLLLEDLWDLHCKQTLPPNWALLCLPQGGNESELRAAITQRFGANASDLALFLTHLHCFPLTSLSFNQMSDLNTKLTELNQELELESNFLFYPGQDLSAFLRIIHTLGLSRPPEVKGFRRLLLDLPQNHNLEELKSTNRELHELFREEQIYRRIAGLSQGLFNQILRLRFANSVFEPLWNHHQINYIEVSLAQNHLSTPFKSKVSSPFAEWICYPLLQIMALIAMEPPVLRAENSLRNELLKVFLSLRPIDPSEVSEVSLRGNCPDRVPEATDSEGHRETYFAQRVYIDNGRWAGTPFYLRAGMGLPADSLEIVIHFEPLASQLFAEENTAHNRLWIQLLPRAALKMSLSNDESDEPEILKPLAMRWQGKSTQPTLQASRASLLLDCLAGNQALFLRDDSIETLEKFMQPLKQNWHKQLSRPYTYPATEWGPTEADALFEDLHCRWSKLAEQ